MIKKVFGARFIGVLLCLAVCLGVVFSNSSSVNAAGSVETNKPQYWGDDEGQVTGKSEGYSAGQTVRFTLDFSASEVFVSGDPWGVRLIDGDGSDKLVFELIDYGSGPNLSWGVNIRGTNIKGATVTVTNVTITGTAITPTPKPTVAPTAVPTPKPTEAPKPTVAPTQATAKPTVAPAPTNAPAPNPEPQPADPGPVVAPVVNETTAPTEPGATTATPTPTPTPTPAESEDPEETEETETSVIAPVIAGDGETTHSAATEAGETTPTPTPTNKPYQHAVVANTNKDGKGGFPWWILVVLALLGASGYRYKQLKDEGKTGKAMAFDFIPGGIIGTVAEKINPAWAIVPEVPAEPAPEVDSNGYLKKSNTASIRPVYSNAPSAKPTRGVNTTPVGEAAVASAVATKTATTTKTAAPVDKKPVSTKTDAKPANNVPVQQRPPIKRSKELSSNRAQAVVATAAATTAATKEVPKATVPEKKAEPVNKVPLQERPPIKRPKELSSNPTKATSGTSPVTKTAPVAGAAIAKEIKMSDVNPSASTEKRPNSPFANRVPLSERPPIKRPKNLSVNRASTGAFSGGAAGVAAKKVEPKPEAKPVVETKEEPKEETSIYRRSSSSRDSSKSTMNRPDATELNSNASPSAASLAFKMNAKAKKEFAPAIATAVLPPVQEKVEKASPFKSNGDVPHPVEEVKVNAEPAIARFTEIPVLEKPASPFKPNPNTTADGKMSVNATSNAYNQSAPSTATISSGKAFNPAAAMKALKEMDDVSEAAPAPTPEPPKSGIGGFFSKFKR